MGHPVFAKEIGEKHKVPSLDYQELRDELKPMNLFQTLMLNVFPNVSHIIMFTAERVWDYGGKSSLIEAVYPFDFLLLLRQLTDGISGARNMKLTVHTFSS